MTNRCFAVLRFVRMPAPLFGKRVCQLSSVLKGATLHDNVSEKLFAVAPPALFHQLCETFLRFSQSGFVGTAVLIPCKREQKLCGQLFVFASQKFSFITLVSPVVRVLFCFPERL